MVTNQHNAQLPYTIVVAAASRWAYLFFDRIVSLLLFFLLGRFLLGFNFFRSLFIRLDIRDPGNVSDALALLVGEVAVIVDFDAFALLQFALSELANDVSAVAD